MLVLLSLAPLISLGGCSNEPPPDAVYTQVAVFVDLTEIEEREGSTSLEDPGVLETLLNLVLGSSDFDGGSISFYRLSDESLLRLSFSENISLGTTNDNPTLRSQALNNFRVSTLANAEEFVRVIVGQATASQSNASLNDYQQSHILRPICEYLGRGDTAQSDPPGFEVKQYLVIFSDMLENSNVYSFFQSSIAQGEAAEAFLDECGGIGAPLQMEYQILQQPLGRGNDFLEELQFQADREWKSFFDQIGLEENTALVQPSLVQP
jgi:hypothetical protein